MGSIIICVKKRCFKLRFFRIIVQPFLSFRFSSLIWMSDLNGTGDKRGSWESSCTHGIFYRVKTKYLYYSEPLNFAEHWLFSNLYGLNQTLMLGHVVEYVLCFKRKNNCIGSFFKNVILRWKSVHWRLNIFRDASNLMHLLSVDVT